MRRKAEVVAAVSGGLLTFEEACQRYSLAVEELTGWQRAVNLSGMPGLRVTRVRNTAISTNGGQVTNPQRLTLATNVGGIQT